MERFRQGRKSFIGVNTILLEYEELLKRLSIILENQNLLPRDKNTNVFLSRGKKCIFFEKFLGTFKIDDH